MQKSKEHIRHFLSGVRMSKNDKDLIKQFLGKRRIRIEFPTDTSDNEQLDTITFPQLKAWFESNVPAVGDVISFESGIGLVTSEKWDCFVVDAALLSDSTLSFDSRHLSANDQWDYATFEDMQALQKALANHNLDWNPIRKSIEQREVPESPKFVRMMVMGRQVGIGIFKEIQPDNTLVMFCVKSDKKKINHPTQLWYGKADNYSFFNANEDHRRIIHEELADINMIWNAKCRRIQPNNARAKIGKTYYWINSYWQVKQNVEKGTSSDQIKFNRGNYFLSREMAENVRNKVLNYCREEIIPFAKDNA